MSSTHGANASGKNLVSNAATGAKPCGSGFGSGHPSPVGFLFFSS
jgi:hypothetical protein